MRGQIERVVQERIDRNRGKARVSADLSSEGLATIEGEQQMEKALAPLSAQPGPA